MDKIFSLTTILFILLFLSISNSQNIPKYYKLDHTGSLTKRNNGNPSGNEVQDIVTIGDTIWIVTAKGLNM